MTDSYVVQFKNGDSGLLRCEFVRRGVSLVKKFPLNPAHPERICWGCDRYCPADAMACGNGSVATLHPVELFGEDWMTWGLDAKIPDRQAPPASKSMVDHKIPGAEDGAAERPPNIGNRKRPW